MKKLYSYIVLLSFITLSCNKWEYVYFEDPRPVTIWVDNIGSTTLQIYWTASTDPKFKQYEIHLSENNQSFYLKRSDYYYEAERLIGKVATIEDRNETYGGLKNLDPNTTYYIIVRVRTCYDTYADSEVLKVQTLAE